MEQTATKISGLAVDTEYSFYLVLKTSGGTYTSNELTVKTHAMNNLTGITVTPGILPPPMRETLETAIERIGAKMIDTIRIDTTHFICTEGRGRDWERANEMNIPVVRPEWIEGCEREGKIIGVRGYYLDADPKQRQIGSNPSLAGRPSTVAAPSQSSIPQRSKEPVTSPKSPDRESTVSGEPGPEVPPTPPQKDLPPTPAAGEEDDDEEEESEEEPEPQATEAKDKQKAEKSDAEEDDENDEEPEEDSSDDKSQDPHTEEKHQPLVEDAKEGAEMEDVAL